MFVFEPFTIIVIFVVAPRFPSDLTDDHQGAHTHAISLMFFFSLTKSQERVVVMNLLIVI